MPLVSIIIPTYKRQELVIKAVNSAQRQTYNNIEILVCDDEKSNATKQIIEYISTIDERVKYLVNNRKKGACGARNTGILAARGEYILFLDDDNEMLPEAVETFVQDDQASAAFLYAWKKRIYDNGKTKIEHEPPTATNKLLTAALSNFADIFIFVKSEHIRSVLLDEDMPACQDYDLCLRLTKQFGTAYCVEKPLYIYRSSKTLERISDNPLKKYRGMRKIVLKHIDDFLPQDRKKYIYNTRKKLYGINLKYAFAWLNAKEALR